MIHSLPLIRDIWHPIHQKANMQHGAPGRTASYNTMILLNIFFSVTEILHCLIPVFSTYSSLSPSKPHGILCFSNINSDLQVVLVTLCLAYLIDIKVQVSYGSDLKKNQKVILCKTLVHPCRDFKEF